MRNVLLSALLTISISAFANPIDDNCSKFVTNGAPVSPIKENTQYICKLNYAVHYRYDTRTAEYVVEHVTKEAVSGKAKRKNDFRQDPDIPDSNEAALSDYAGNPYDRGHLAPAANNTISKEVMSESFYLTNMVPQVPNHNRGIWRILELKVRSWALEPDSDIYVASGTVYEPGFKTIGTNKVGVPSKLWKVVIDIKNKRAIAFLFPHTPLAVKDLPKFAVTIAEVEKATGINFMPKLPADLAFLETEPVNLKKWNGLE